MEQSTIGELVRRLETDFIRGNTQISKYVNHSMHETLEKIDAYSNSKHISGPKDRLNRDKPFFNISKGAVNIWFRATDLDRKNMRIRASATGQQLAAFLATVRLRDWMRREDFGSYLNEWGRVLSKYGSAVTKTVENKDGLHVSVTPWNRLICDAVDFEANPKIEILELTEGQLRERVDTHGYDAEMVEDLIASLSSRETVDKNRKDNKADYIKLYEIHLFGKKSLLTGKESDMKRYVQQMHVISYVSSKNGRKTEYTDYTLFSGEEEYDPYTITHLLKEDGRTLSIGAVENLFEAQWMVNHSMKLTKDTLDIANRLIFQTSDRRFLNQNVAANMESGSVLVHGLNQPLTKVDTSKPDIVSTQNFAMQWKQLGNEINGISDAMLGAAPKSGTAWRQTEALLQENYSLFELMTENKALSLERLLRTRVIPYIKKGLDTAEEITAQLEQYEIDKIDSIYIPREAINRYNKRSKDQLLNSSMEQLLQGNTPSPYQPQLEEMAVRNELNQMGNERFFVPTDFDSTTWKEVFKDLEWEVEVAITDEERDTQEALSTINMVLKLVMTPGFEQNKRAQAIVSRALELTGVMSPIEYSALPSSPAMPVPGGPTPGADLMSNGGM